MAPAPQVLKRRDLPSLAKFMKSDQCEKVVLMLGAGVSTSAGIPDFRSPKTGLYSNLARLNLPHPEAVFEIGFFRKNPEPFYTLAQELYPGKFRPTLTHSFVKLLADKGLLTKCFTQNIDTLERRAGVPADLIIEAHGSFATQRCIDCKTPFDDERMREHILGKKTPRCDRCKGLVKPDIVFFGESLPEEFFPAMRHIQEADLLIVMGTSLTVHPFASLTELTQPGCVRLLINLERVGDFGKESDDVILLGKCDETVKRLCKELGWLDELMELWEATAASVAGDLGKRELKGKGKKQKVPWTPKAEWFEADNYEEEENQETVKGEEEKKIEEEVEQITAAIEATLSLGGKKQNSESSQEPQAVTNSGAQKNPPPAQERSETRSGQEKL